MDYGKNLDLNNIVYFCELDNIFKTEQWKDVPNYEGLYQVSDLGRVKSLNYKQSLIPKIMTLVQEKNGYYKINMSKNGIVTNKKPHKLVAEVFLNHTPCRYELVVNHKNFNKLDNRKTNLEIVTARENSNKKHLQSSSIYTGVFVNDKTKQITSRVVIGRKTIHLGTFKTEKEASMYYENAVKSINNNTEIIVNKPKYTSTYKGVCWDKRTKKWLSQIKINGKTKHLGHYENEIDAYKAFQKALNKKNLTNS